MPRTWKLAVAALAVPLAFAAVAAAQAPDPAALITAAPQTASAKTVTAVDGLEIQVLREINALRRSRGLKALRRNTALAAAAAAHSTEMAQKGFFAHESADGSPFWKRVQTRYPERGLRHWEVGENLVWASPGLSAKQAATMWMNSPPHRKILLSPQWREVGLGGVHAVRAPGAFQGLDATILTADFGARR